jgi:hypothetical protein
VTLTVVGSTAREVYSGGAVGPLRGADDAHRQAPLETMHALAADRRLAAVWAAQLAGHAAILVHVDVLAREWSAPAVDTAALAGVQAVQRGPPKLVFEGAGIAEQGHADGVRHIRCEPSQMG